VQNEAGPSGNGQEREVDVVVFGAGAAGLTAAVLGRLRGLEVVVLEKDRLVGGTTAISGGVLWVPLSRHGLAQEPTDDALRVEEYLRAEMGDAFDPEELACLLRCGPLMIDQLEQRTCVRFEASSYPDYHPDAPGGARIGRALVAKQFDLRALGQERRRLRQPLDTLTFLGMTFNSSNGELRHFFNATKSFQSFRFVARRILSHVFEVMRYGSSIRATGGHALAARLFKAALDLGITVHTGTAVRSLEVDGRRVAGVVADVAGRPLRIRARRAVVLATGGFSHDEQTVRERFAHLPVSASHVSLTPSSVSGDGIRLARSVGAGMAAPRRQPAAWMPVSHVPRPGGRFSPFPHLLDRYKPGVIAVLKDGRRFTNESNSYHDVGVALISACAGAEAQFWLVCDQRAIRKYGLGHVKPHPVPLRRHIRSGYLHRAATLEELGAAMGVDGLALAATVRAFNEHARLGVDPAFGRGTTAFNRYLGDPAHAPNPCVAPIDVAPFYGVRVTLADLSTYDGILADSCGRALRGDRSVIDGLYVVGADRASMMGGAYPGPGINHGPHMATAFAAVSSIAQNSLESDDQRVHLRECRRPNEIPQARSAADKVRER
jgi:succinate dehydrogenase/fumarate reductase flavoprotein subunit